MGNLTWKRRFVRVIQMFRPDSDKDIGGRRVVLKIQYSVVYVLCVRVCVCACMCVLCVRDINIQRIFTNVNVCHVYIVCHL